MKDTESRRWVFNINYESGHSQFFGIHQKLMFKDPKRSKLWKGLEDTLNEDSVKSIGYKTYEEYQKVYNIN
jgi:hypothetical protein